MMPLGWASISPDWHALRGVNKPQNARFNHIGGNSGEIKKPPSV